MAMMSMFSCRHNGSKTDNNSTQEIRPQESAWDSPSMWYQSGTPYDTDKIDVFYLVSTEVLSATDSLGNETWQSQLIPSDRSSITGEMDWIGENMFREEFNIVSPYYHQFTFDAIIKPSHDHFDSIYKQVADEVCEA
ncbi:MAG: hypothetical protein MJZ14_08170, partial [Paludibacteraceae bacterium]|nr:hypothetical protein [Paludibacteraceae bacterium]